MNMFRHAGVYAQIAGTGMCVPDAVVTNEALTKMVETTDEWIVSRTGIKERRSVHKQEASSDLAYRAAKRALEDADTAPGQVDLVLVATATPDMLFPSTACLVQNRLGIKNVPAFDLSAACSGFIYGLAAADAFIRSGVYKTVLLIGVETLTKFTDYTDRTTCIIFGDGAGAAVIKATKAKKGVIGSKLYADGGKWDFIRLPGGGSRTPSYACGREDYYLKMNGHETFKVAVRGLEQAIVDLLKACRMKTDDVDLVIPHQANMRIIETVARKLDFPMKRIFVNIEKYGNTSAASIPMALHEAVHEKRIKDGDTILTAAFGSGLTWGANLIRW